MNPMIKIDPARLPKPPLPRTRPVRIGEVVSDHEVRGLIYQMEGQTEDEKASARKGRQISARVKKVNAWTPEKDEELLRLRAAGKSYSEIVEITGRTLSAVEHRLIRLKKEGKYCANWMRGMPQEEEMS